MRQEFPIIETMGRSAAEVFIAGPDDVAISICHPGGEPARLSGNFKDVLRLVFDDTVGIPRTIETEGQYTWFDEEMADEVIRFAAKHRSAKRLIVHCAAGISRSVAIAQALSLSFANRWYFPRWYDTTQRGSRFVHNRHVFDIVYAAYRRWQLTQETAPEAQAP